MHNQWWSDRVKSISENHTAYVLFFGFALTMYFVQGLVFTIGPLIGAVPFDSQVQPRPIGVFFLIFVSALVTLLIKRLYAVRTGTQTCITIAAIVIQIICGCALPIIVLLEACIPSLSFFLACVRMILSGIMLASGLMCWFRALEVSMIGHLARVTELALVASICIFLGICSISDVVLFCVATVVVGGLHGIGLAAIRTSVRDSERAPKNEEQVEKYLLHNLINEIAQGFVYGALAAFIFLKTMSCGLAAAALFVGAAGVFLWEPAIYKLATNPLSVQRVLQAFVIVGLSVALSMIALDVSGVGLTVAGFVALAGLAHFAAAELNNMLIRTRENSFKSVLFLTEHVCPILASAFVGMIAATAVASLVADGPRAAAFCIPVLIAIMAVASIGFIDVNKGRRPIDEDASEQEDEPEQEQVDKSFNDSDMAGRWFAEEYGLSKRETEVLLLLLRGRNTRTIQEKLAISSSTVKTHTSRIYQKMGIRGRQELVDSLEAFKSGRATSGSK